jgi:hypothetical protein
MNHLIVCCTRDKFSITPLSQSLGPEPKFGSNSYFTTQIFEHNKQNISSRYNQVLKEYKNSPNFDSLIFIHDDVEIVDPCWLEKLEEAYKEYDIVGLAGGLNPKIQAPILWHIMCGKENCYGAVGHFTDTGERFLTLFGPTPHRICVLDGLFLAINLKTVEKTEWKFQEEFNRHCYDISASLYANELKLKMGVWPISVYHKSPGLRDINDKIFLDDQQKFLDKWIKK